MDIYYICTIFSLWDYTDALNIDKCIWVNYCIKQLCKSINYTNWIYTKIKMYNIQLHNQNLALLTFSSILKTYFGYYN